MEWWLNSEFLGTWDEVLVAYFKLGRYSGTYLDWQQAKRSPGWVLNLVPSEYEVDKPLDRDFRLQYQLKWPFPVSKGMRNILTFAHSRWGSGEIATNVGWGKFLKEHELSVMNPADVNLVIVSPC
jgi:hypothetical protein